MTARLASLALAGMLTLAAAADRVPPLEPYLRCGASDSLVIGRTDRVLDNRRQIHVGWKTYDIRVQDGYRLLYGYPGADVPMANVKIERGAKYYAREKGWIIDLHRHYEKKGLKFVQWNLHGFDVYGAEQDSLDGAGVPGHYTAFGDSNRLVISVYLLNQGPGKNRYDGIEAYRSMRQDFLDDLLTCADSVRRLE